MQIDFSTVVKEAEGFKRRLARMPESDAGFRDYAVLLTEARTLRIHTAEAALQLRDGTDRHLLLRLRQGAIEAERNVMSQLGRFRSRHAPGGTE
jgi:hypothetical protein